MTTVATDGYSIACDTQACWGDMRVSSSRNKIHKINGEYVGCAGGSEFIAGYLNYLKGEGDMPETSDPYSFLFLTKGGVYLSTDIRFPRLKVSKVMAIGSGREYALGAMLAGASPLAAVRIAKKLDTATGGSVKVFYKSAL